MAGRRRLEDEECKMFVGGLTRDTTTDMLRDYFNYYGRVVHAVVMTNPETQKSRGFGFVSFANPESVDNVIMSGPHFLDGKQIDPKPSVPKDLRPKPPQVEQPKKAFLGGLPLEMNEADLREFFSSYGVVTECYIMFDEKRMKSRGFGFVSFEDDSIVDGLVSRHYIEVRDKRVEVKLARPRENPLAPLNSEARVLSMETQQQRMAAMAAEAVSVRSRPMPPYYDQYDSYRPREPYPPEPPFHYGPPNPKRARFGAASGPPPPATDYYRAYEPAYDEPRNPPPPLHTRSAYPFETRPDTHFRAIESRPESIKLHTRVSAGAGHSGASSTAAASYLDSSPGQSTMRPSIDPSTMTSESMATLMQQAMQNMGGGMGMVMPMLMSNVMTQMFMSQAQNMFQSMMQQKGSGGSAESVMKQEGGTPSQSEMMDAMKNVLQTLMKSMQQQQQRQNETEADSQ